MTTHEPNLFLPYAEPGELEGFLSRPLTAGHVSACVEHPLDSQTVVAFAHVAESSVAGIARALSRRSGGFAVARTRACEWPLVFFCGFALPDDPSLTWSHAFEALCGISWRPELAGGLETVFTAAPKGTLRRNGPWVRLALAQTTANAVRSLDQSLITLEGWSWTERHTPLAGLPFVLLDRPGPFDEQLARVLCVRLGVYGAATEIAPTQTRSWWFEPSGRCLQQDDQRSADVVREWAEWAALSGEAGGIVRRPGEAADEAI
jgi:hypothetical protein